MICQLQIIFFSALLVFYSTSSLVTERYYMCYQSCQSSQSSELIELPEVFSSMKKHLLHSALRLGGPTLGAPQAKVCLLEL